MIHIDKWALYESFRLTSDLALVVKERQLASHYTVQLFTIFTSCRNFVHEWRGQPGRHLGSAAVKVDVLCNILEDYQAMFVGNKVRVYV